jgi:AhpD family alkylhydroperoxidase
MSTFPSRRLALAERAPRQYAALARLDEAVELDGCLRELVKLRASQINGCAFCIDMHWKDARAAGESEDRLYSLAAWHESSLYDARERAALALCEAVTLVAETHVPDDAWRAAEEVFSKDELAQLVFAITAINAWNRLAISARTEPGHYQPARP